MATKPGELTPMMKQFYNLKAKHPEALLLFRCGDFYETYAKDAIEASRILGITLTKRNNGASVGDAMAGFPHHALDTYLPKLIRAGRRVAICDQLEDPKLAKKLVKRGITELVTPGVAMSDTVLNHKENNFLCALHMGKGTIGVAFLDISTGEYLCDQGNAEYVQKMLSSFGPKETLIERGHRGQVDQLFGNGVGETFELDDWVFTMQTALQKLTKHFHVKNMKGFGVANLSDGLIAASAILQYLEYTQHTEIGHITTLKRIDANRYVRLDNFTLNNLEILQPLHEGGTSLVDIIDNTTSPMGARMLRRWLIFPLREKNAICERHDAVDYFFREPESREVIEEELRRIGDMERIVSRVATGKVMPREVMQLKHALTAIKPIRVVCMQATGAPSAATGSNSAETPVLRRVGERLDTLDELRTHIEQWLEPELPTQVNKGGVIRTGVCPELDELRHIAYSGKDYLLQLQKREVDRTGIMSLKVGFNNVFGYYLEVRNTFKDKVPSDWIRKQTLAQAERYITEELKEYEEKILGAEERILALETKLYTELVQYVQQFIKPLQQDAVAVAELDCLISFAITAAQHRYVRPVIDNSSVIDIRQGRHPVIETNMPVGEEYVPNDVTLQSPSPTATASPLPASPLREETGTAGETGISVKPGNTGESGTAGTSGAPADPPQIIIITGPNMAGKSALLRQTALIVLLAQIGSYVPAESARIGIVDKIFTRVGASDSISTGESTFMVEMTEAANILNNVTDRSLVLFDELGRGTSTYDGISIAWSIIEHLHEQQGCRARTLFATHYHELNEMEKHYSRIKNYNVSVKDINGRIIFLRKLVAGGSEHSFGIHVAQLAGMPPSIIRRANEVLQSLEKEGNEVGAVGKKVMSAASAAPQLSFFQLDDPVLMQIRDEILGIDINSLTPLEALNKLSEIKKIVNNK
ncbi:MAG: DNA mismatch repair protein MutS [Prevotella sp.]|nr:DNA mismatch repair protein MutS [Prevotella sp.]